MNKSIHMNIEDLNDMKDIKALVQALVEHDYDMCEQCSDWTLGHKLTEGLCYECNPEEE